MVNSDELIVATECLTLQVRCVVLTDDVITGSYSTSEFQSMIFFVRDEACRHDVL